MKKIILVLFLVLSLLACGKKKEDDPVPPVVDPVPPVVQVDVERELTCVANDGGLIVHFFAPTDTDQLSRLIIIYVNTLDELEMTADFYESNKERMVSMLNSTYSGVSFATSRDGDYVTQEYTLIISELGEEGIADFDIDALPTDLDDIFGYFGSDTNATCSFKN